MLLRFRLEVEEDSAQAAVDALVKYEHALQVAEMDRIYWGSETLADMSSRSTTSSVISRSSWSL